MKSVYYQYIGLVRGRVSHIVGTRDGVDELTQQVFISYMQHARKHNVRNVAGWLYHRATSLGLARVQRHEEMALYYNAEGLTHGEIAKFVGCSPRAVARQLRGLANPLQPAALRCLGDYHLARYRDDPQALDSPRRQHVHACKQCQGVLRRFDTAMLAARTEGFPFRLAVYASTEEKLPHYWAILVPGTLGVLMFACMLAAFL